MKILISIVLICNILFAENIFCENYKNISTKIKNQLEGKSNHQLGLFVTTIAKNNSSYYEKLYGELSLPSLKGKVDSNKINWYNFFMNFEVFKAKLYFNDADIFMRSSYFLIHMKNIRKEELGKLIDSGLNLDSALDSREFANNFMLDTNNISQEVRIYTQQATIYILNNDLNGFLKWLMNTKYFDYSKTMDNVCKI